MFVAATHLKQQADAESGPAPADNDDDDDLIEDEGVPVFCD